MGSRFLLLLPPWVAWSYLGMPASALTTGCPRLPVPHCSGITPDLEETAMLLTSGVLQEHMMLPRGWLPKPLPSPLI
ncbi:hypothetical protein chiPu_0013947 [Chiloscyllium punctatum]|uniref:Secreted protein n=1 Tax=Chiloscyllium punctatum TaxID=137246 RepID=A0A401SYI2_CHIPU|nr:hypothetical protein [Chiloscyllium punctatum]